MLIAKMHRQQVKVQCPDYCPSVQGTQSMDFSLNPYVLPCPIILTYKPEKNIYTLETPRTSSWLSNQQQGCLAGLSGPAECPIPSGQRGAALHCAESKQLFQEGGSAAWSLRCRFPVSSQSTHMHAEDYASLPLFLRDDSSGTSTRVCSPQRACSGVSCRAARLVMAYFRNKRLLLLSSPITTENQAGDLPRCLGRTPSSGTPRAAAEPFLLLCIPSPPHALSHGTTVTP